jgi:acyl carrier protein
VTARRFCAPIPGQSADNRFRSIFEMDRAATAERIGALIAPFNKKGVALTDDATFSGDLEFDSLTVMDFVAAIEDEFDIIISMNQQAEIETYGQLVDAVVKLQK